MDRFIDKRRQDELLKVAEQAAAWAIALEDELGPKERATFAEWLAESPLHIELFLRASAVDQLGGLLAPETRSRLEAAMHASAGADTTVLPLQIAVPPPRPRTPQRKSFIGWGAGIAAAAALAGVVFWFGSGTLVWQRYATAVGEQRSVALSDGSVVYLNSASQVSVRYWQGVREVRLAGGEAIFKVAHDTTRPFRVYVDDAVVEAVGTQFDIYRKSTQTTVAVIEGIVEISERLEPHAQGRSTGNSTPRAEQSTRAQLPPPATRLLAGEAVQLNLDGQVSKPTPINVTQVTAWRQRRLIFEWERLETIVAEFNRYNRTQIRIDDAALRERRYTAVFDANEPRTLLQFLAKEHGLEFEQQGDEFIIRNAEQPDRSRPPISAEAQ